MVENEFDMNGVGRFEMVADPWLRRSMQRAAWLSQRMAFGSDLAMGNFWRMHCGWIMADGTVAARGKGMGVKARLKTEAWRDVISVAAVKHGLLGLRGDGTVLYAGDDRKFGRAVSQLRDVKQMDAYEKYAAFLLRDGTVRANRINHPYEFENVYLEGVRQVVMGQYGEYLALMEDGTLRGAAAKGLEHWRDLVWVSLCDADYTLKNRRLVSALTSSGGMRTSFLEGNQLSGSPGEVCAMAVYHPVSGQNTLFALQPTGHLAFSEIKDAEYGSYRKARHREDYVALWQDHEGYIRGISDNGLVRELTRVSVDSDIFPEKLEW